MRYYSKDLKEKYRQRKARKKQDNRLAVLFVIAILFWILWQAYYYENHYDKVAKVKSVDNGVVTIEDTNGFKWEFIGTGFKQGMIVKARMFTNYTDNIIGDDVVENVNAIEEQYVKGY